MVIIQILCVYITVFLIGRVIYFRKEDSGYFDYMRDLNQEALDIIDKLKHNENFIEAMKNEDYDTANKILNDAIPGWHGDIYDFEEDDDDDDYTIFERIRDFFADMLDCIALGFAWVYVKSLQVYLFIREELDI